MSMPEWLDFFEKSSLLTETQKCFVREVYTHISSGMGQLKHVITGAPKTKSDRTLALPEFELIKKNVISLKRANTDFRKNFNEWKKIREENVELLTQTAEILNTDRFNCNVSRLVGTSVSIAGGALAAGGVIASVFTLGAASPLAIAGFSMIGLGTTTTVGASIAELVRLKSNLEHAKVKLQEEKKTHESIVSVFTCYQELIENFQHIIESAEKSIYKELWMSIKEAVKNSSRVGDFLKVIAVVIAKLPNANYFPYPFLLIAEIVCMMVLAAYFSRGNNLAFDLVTLTSKILLGAGIIATDVVDIGVDVSFMAVGGASAARVAARGALVSVSIILDTTTLVMTSIDVHNGSISPQAEKMREYALYLKTEMENIERFYSQM